jgi:hypothetical protein
MLSINSKLDSLGLVECKNLQDGSRELLPGSLLITNISFLWKILGQVVQDWNNKVVPYQTAIDTAPNENASLYHFLIGWQSLKPAFLQCLFSYVMFFVALDGAYGTLYHELNALHLKAFFPGKHDKPPAKSPYIHKVRRIRNISIAHINEPKAKPETRMAAMMWESLNTQKDLNEGWSLDKLAFGAFKLKTQDADGKTIEESEDIEVKGITELDQNCTAYLAAYDRVCADFLTAIQERLPITIGSEHYSVRRPVSN